MAVSEMLAYHQFLKQQVGNRQKELSFSNGISKTHKNAILLKKKNVKKVKKKKERKVSLGEK